MFPIRQAACRHDIWHQGKESRSHLSSFSWEVEDSTRWSLRSLLALNFRKSPMPHNWHLLVSLIFACFLVFPFLLYVSCFPIFFFNGLPVEKPCLALLHPDQNGPILVIWGQPSLAQNPRSPDLGSENSPIRHLFSSCRHWLSAWHPLVSRLSFAVQFRQSRAFFLFSPHEGAVPDK